MDPINSSAMEHQRRSNTGVFLCKEGVSIYTECTAFPISLLPIGVVENVLHLIRKMF